MLPCLRQAMRAAITIAITTAIAGLSLLPGACGGPPSPSPSSASAACGGAKALAQRHCPPGFVAPAAAP